MQLTPAHRRDVVEDILDIKIFSKMNWILKQKIKTLKENQGGVKQQFVMIDTKISMITDHIEYTKGKSRESKATLEKKIEKNQKDVQKLLSEVSELTLKVEDWRDNVLPKQAEFKNEQSDFIRVKAKLNDNSTRMEREIKFFQENDECPTCEQSITSEFKIEAQDKRADKMMTNACALIRMDEQLSEMDAREKLYNTIAEDTREFEVDSAKKKTSANSISTFNTDLRKQIEELQTIDADLIEDKTKLKIYKEELKTIEKQKNKLTEDNNYLMIAKQLLQDSGIKTKIIKKYLPIMNKLINGLLSQLEFQVKFELDEQFNETIKSRYRDEFAYANFSEGEKMRIDLALLFTWRHIAKMKNSTNTNLLVLDEIFDSSLDMNGTDEFLKILNSLSNENIFLISHKSDLSVDKFDSLIRFEKVQNFTKVTT
jgi:DNA repair exonuclease SbcCD ATPase subunit